MISATSTRPPADVRNRTVDGVMVTASVAATGEQPVSPTGAHVAPSGQWLDSLDEGRRPALGHVEDQQASLARDGDRPGDAERVQQGG